MPFGGVVSRAWGASGRARGGARMRAGAARSGRRKKA